MFLDLVKFVEWFPTYDKFGIPMWSDWKSNKEESILSVAIPGYDKEDFEVYVDSDGLSLKIKRGDKGDLLYSILSKTSLLSYTVEDIKAEYKSGVLKITIPKSKPKETKRVMIEIS